ncbi:MAG TPA: thiamine phosphate synthase [Chitinophagales bacterium]|nr:thiamine phosphate synthase [Chitinophagales bacterium]HMV15209.1 thiamine phosphate synthase [Chitinophagales bacterium]HMW12339.1 thiamine phosphate synthase [Chitinophagales bacterium]HMX59978.1 thiamine phosphate synthase [Chitinophagales bacterium]HMY22287.1 thiamine phosphate synthase [Chitinophagales bacterium]
MQVIIYTSPTAIENEIEIISQLFDCGLDYLYIRKPDLDDFSLVDFVEQIPEKYWKRCISTSMIITKEFNLGGYHFTRDIVQKNEKYNDKILDWLHSNHKISSVSAHKLEEIEKYKIKFNHVIVSPLFNSISKENHRYDWNFAELKNVLQNLKSENINHKIFAVGGIDLDKIEIVKNLNFDGVGLLGAIWSNTDNAIEKFSTIKKQYE